MGRSRCLHRAHTKIHTDDTQIRVSGGQGQQARTGRLWTYVRDDRASGDATPQAVWFQYSPNRKGEQPRRHLAGFKGTVQADAFAGYDRLLDSGEIIEAGRWAHARRKFYDVHMQQHQQSGTLAHLHEFEFAEGRYGVPDPDWPDESMDDETKVTLTKALGYSATFTWTYDFGDDWTHKIKVDRVDTMPAELKLQFPMCLVGAGTCPSEDVGGTPGYADFLQAISDSAHPEHDDMTWIERPFDPNAFNVQEAQDRLYEIRL